MVKRCIGERAYNSENKPFRSVELDVAVGDTLYMGTDGLSDLFGGSRRLRFTKKRVMGAPFFFCGRCCKKIAAVPQMGGGRFSLYALL